MKVLIHFSPLLLLATNVWAQTCVDVNANTDRFTTNSDGTVADSVTGLMWQRCSVGQVYNSQTQSCDGTAQQLTWQQALTASQQNNYAGYEDWQVPNIKELASILQQQCVDPAIDINVFPQTLSNNYWSATTQTAEPSFAWVYQFADGKNNPTNKNAAAFLRLVRYYR
ncbi:MULTISPECIES: Lcl C-terminal domain-containing protein [unclassified Pseudoalteromonas]|uniref:Lcl C-terminal domain-containing protein n=1 Tax=unclassified Pseudoalteromonas TaxID=194690 RepID=UPI003014EE71